MPNVATVAKNVTYAALGVFVAGWVMNALRQVGFVRSAIQGFDA